MTQNSQVILLVSTESSRLEHLIELLAAPEGTVVAVLESDQLLSVILDTTPQLLILDTTVDAPNILNHLSEQPQISTLPVIVVGDDQKHDLMNYNEWESLFVEQIPVHGPTLHKRVALYTHDWRLSRDEFGIDFFTLLNIISERIVCLSNDLLITAINDDENDVIPAGTLVGSSFLKLLPEEAGKVFLKRIDLIRHDKEIVQYEDEIKEKTFKVTVAPTIINNEVVAFTIAADDITEIKEKQRDIERLQNYDLLTGVSSRQAFNDFLSKAMSRARRNNRTLALCYIDLDNFKNINTTLGHDAADQLLKSVAQRLVAMVRSSDLVARVGADEFALILDEVSRPEDAAQVAEKVIKTINAEHDLGPYKTGIAASIGISFFAGGNETREELFKTADIAMLNAKKNGRNGYQFFSDDMQNKAINRMRLEEDLRRAVQRRQFELYYQPQVDAVTGEVVALEALIRWQHHELGMVSPAEFIPLAEETRLISSIGDWVIRNATQGNKEWWAENGVTLPQLTVAINVSVQQLTDPSFPAHVASLIEESDIDPHQLEIEITETALMEDPEQAIAILEQIKALGIRLAIDDFGTGYSSLAYIKRLPVDVLKVDLSFVRDIGKDKKTEAIIKSTISLAHNLGLQVVAEGVETEEQIEFLRNEKCDILQGYYFSRPLPAEELVIFLRESWNKSQL